MFVLGKPADCTEEFGALFENQIATLRDVIVQDMLELRAAKKVTIVSSNPINVVLIFMDRTSPSRNGPVMQGQTHQENPITST